MFCGKKKEKINWPRINADGFLLKSPLSVCICGLFIKLQADRCYGKEMLDMESILCVIYKHN